MNLLIKSTGRQPKIPNRLASFCLSQKTSWPDQEPNQGPKNGSNKSIKRLTDPTVMMNIFFFFKILEITMDEDFSLVQKLYSKVGVNVNDAREEAGRTALH